MIRATKCRSRDKAIYQAPCGVSTWNRQVIVPRGNDLLPWNEPPARAYLDRESFFTRVDRSLRLGDTCCSTHHHHHWARRRRRVRPDIYLEQSTERSVRCACCRVGICPRFFYRCCDRASTSYLCV